MGKQSGGINDAIFAAGDSVIGAAILAGIGFLAGTWLDSKLHTTPWLTVVLALIGVILGLVRMVKKAMQMNETDASGTATAATYSSGTSADWDEDNDRDANAPASSLSSTPPKPPQESAPRPERKELNPKSAFDFLTQDDQNK